MNKKTILILALIGTTISFGQIIYGDTTSSNETSSVNDQNPTPGAPATTNPPKNNAPDTQNATQTKGLLAPKALFNKLDRTVAEIDQSAGSQSSNVMTAIFSAIGGSFLLLGVIFFATRIYEGNREEKEKVDAAKKSLEEAIKKEYPQKKDEPEKDYEKRIKTFLDKAQELQGKNKPKSDESSDDYSKRILELAAEEEIISTEESKKVKSAEQEMVAAIGRAYPKMSDEKNADYDQRIKSILERAKKIRTDNKPESDESEEDYVKRMLDLAVESRVIPETAIELLTQAPKIQAQDQPKAGDTRLIQSGETAGRLPPTIELPRTDAASASVRMGISRLAIPEEETLRSPRSVASDQIEDSPTPRPAAPLIRPDSELAQEQRRSIAAQAGRDRPKVILPPIPPLRIPASTQTTAQPKSVTFAPDAPATRTSTTGAGRPALTRQKPGQTADSGGSRGMQGSPIRTTRGGPAWYIPTTTPRGSRSFSRGQ